LDQVNVKAALLKLSRRRMGGLLEAEIIALDQIQQSLRNYLSEQHRITQVKLTTPTHSTSNNELR